MNIQSPSAEKTADLDEARAALARLRAWVSTATPEELAAVDPAVARLLPGNGLTNHVPLSRDYPSDFVADEDYRATLPDLQNGPESLIRGAKKTIQHVGISNFRLPIRYRSRDGGEGLTLESSITGTVSLDGGRKGINMSRIMRSFYAHSARAFSFEVMDAVLDDYKRDLDTFDARLLMRFSYPMLRPSLRSGLQGYQYYDIALEVVEHGGTRNRILHLDYVYSSTCPCSLELAEHARAERGQLATPHSQRSVARISVLLDPSGGCLWFEDLIELCRRAVPTETQVMVKREDEQAFAELNAANPIFVEDAARLFCEELRKSSCIRDFRVVASHQESLHSHDAVSVLVEGETFSAESLDPTLFASLIHRG